jgi:hypothetical protein
MDINPYEPPRPLIETTTINNDALKFPADACHFVSMLGLTIWGLVVLSLSLLAFFDPQFFKRDPIKVKHILELIYFLGLSILPLHISRCLRTRTNRWQIIAASLFSLTPFSGFILAPIGLLILTRILNKDVWNSFAKPESKDS